MALVVVERASELWRTRDPRAIHTRPTRDSSPFGRGAHRRSCDVVARRTSAAGRRRTGRGSMIEPVPDPIRRVAPPLDSHTLEWLVCNGLGGYASGTAFGLPTR